jgi:hypothetical protein
MTLPLVLQYKSLSKILAFEECFKEVNNTHFILENTYNPSHGLLGVRELLSKQERISLCEHFQVRT